MNYRQFGRIDWEISGVGYGMWGMGSWSNSDDNESLGSLQASVDFGCTFFDTAYAYGEGRSEKLLGQIVRSNSSKRLYTATKVPPKNLQWPAAPDSTLTESYPPDHV
ncbi:MAG: aldo/keto reductase, partial [Acidobacteria bacterium]